MLNNALQKFKIKVKTHTYYNMSASFQGGGFSGVGSLLKQLTPLAAIKQNYTGTPATGTGIKPFVAWAKAQGLLTPITIQIIVPQLQGLFGGYPKNKATEIGPDGLFIALFAILFLSHLGMWMFNLTRKHNFFLQLGFAFFCALKVIGFACRLAWAHNVANISLGIASVIFIQVGQLILQSLNLVLAHRIFTWRHPETGSHWLFVHFINLIYMVVLAVIVMAILGEALPFVYFMGQHHYNMCKNVMKAAAVLNLFYASLPLQFLVVAYALKPGTIYKRPKIFNKFTQREERPMPLVYQPSWIKSAQLFYYPQRGSQIQIYKGEPGSDAVRIIASREPPGNGHHQFSHVVNPDAPHFHWATVTVLITSLVLVLNTCFRVAGCFRTSNYATLKNNDWHVNFWPWHPYVMFIFYGATEVFIIVFYLCMRIDLRFYIPDMVKKVPKGGLPNRAVNFADNPITNWVQQDFEKETSRT